MRRRPRAMGMRPAAYRGKRHALPDQPALGGFDHLSEYNITIYHEVDACRLKIWGIYVGAILIYRNILIRLSGV